MISILTQERLLGAALGTVMASVVVFEQRKSIHKSISENQSRFSPQSQCLRRYLDDQLLLVIESVYNWGDEEDEDVEVADSRSTFFCNDRRNPEVFGLSLFPCGFFKRLSIQRERMGKSEWVTGHWVNRVILEGSGHWVKNKE
uniref:Uncharacterized protein n=1 Tax=Solanum tuberosum TaxID=4113 RepID=M1AE34_SOLTU